MKYQFTTNLDDMDMDLIHAVLHDSYWCKGIPRDVVEKSARNSLCFGLVTDSQQFAFGRFVTDEATFAYLADVFVVTEYRGQGLGKHMMQCAMALPELNGLRRIMLATRDAHDLYKHVGFEAIDDSVLFMQKWQPNIYEDC